ncbi:hypothetical protein BDF19DRAFT_66547 [Syncephalis fuscata]|nr:hypothetical protein BDF19DRAFT_66547 [Syncephalis fuscata]
MYKYYSMLYHYVSIYIYIYLCIYLVILGINFCKCPLSWVKGFVAFFNSQVLIYTYYCIIYINGFLTKVNDLVVLRLISNGSTESSSESICMAALLLDDFWRAVDGLVVECLWSILGCSRQ